MSDKVYYLRIRGRVTGPFGADELQRMANMGTLSRAHEVSADGQTWQSANRLEQLFHAARRASAAMAEQTEAGAAPPELSVVQDDAAPVLSPVVQGYSPAGSASWPAAQGIPSSAGRPGDSSPGPAVPGRGLSAKVGRLSLTQGICTAGVVLFCLLVPHARGANGLQWWWNLSSQISLLLFCIYGMLMGAALTFVPVLIRGQWRGWVYLAASAVAALLLTAAIGLSPGGSVALAIAVPMPLTVAAMIGVSLLRLAAPAAGGMRAWQIAAGAAACAVSLPAGGATVWALAAAGLNSSDRGWIILAVVVAGLGWLVVLAGGVMGLIVGLSRLARPGASKAAVVLSIVGLAVLALVAIIAGFIGATGSGFGDRFVLVQVLRLVVVAYTLGALAAAGLSEVLASRVESAMGQVAGAS